MPMLHDIDQSYNDFQKRSESGISDVIMRKPSEESIRTEFCDGPLFEESAVELVPPLQEDESLYRTERRETSDRAELIERIKRGEKPNWVPSRKVSHFKQLNSILIASIGICTPFCSGTGSEAAWMLRIKL